MWSVSLGTVKKLNYALARNKVHLCLVLRCCKCVHVLYSSSRPRRPFHRVWTCFISLSTNQTPGPAHAPCLDLFAFVFCRGGSSAELSWAFNSFRCFELLERLLGSEFWITDTLLHLAFDWEASRKADSFTHKIRDFCQGKRSFSSKWLGGLPSFIGLAKFQDFVYPTLIYFEIQ